MNPFAVIPPHLGLSRPERSAVNRRAHERYTHKHRLRFMIFVLTIFTFGPFVFCYFPYSIIGQPARPWAPVLVPIAVIALLIPVQFVILRRMMRAPIMNALRDLGYPICDRCTYPLEGINPNSGACPECGADLADQVPVTPDMP